MHSSGLRLLLLKLLLRSCVTFSSSAARQWQHCCYSWRQPQSVDFRCSLLVQGGEETLLLEQVNGYYRRLQYQYLGTRGTPATAGFVIEVHGCCRMCGGVSDADPQLTLQHANCIGISSMCSAD